MKIPKAPQDDLGYEGALALTVVLVQVHSGHDSTYQLLWYVCISLDHPQRQRLSIQVTDKEMGVQNDSGMCH